MKPSATEPLPYPPLFEAILARRSVRAYAPDELDRKAIQTLLNAAVRAPTAMHEEPWAFVVIQNKPLLKQLSDLAKPFFIERLHRTPQAGSHAIDRFADPAFNLFYDAGTLILICTQLSGPFVEADCWMAAENLMLSAVANGLGTCVIGSSIEALNTRVAKEKLDIPADFKVVAAIIAGVPRGETAVTDRKTPFILSWK
uniref:Nitroreductase n=1 Tax=mine drainage metagenome TaxID=410659 RepID=E6QTV3_9ZZZZ